MLYQYPVSRTDEKEILRTHRTKKTIFSVYQGKDIQTQDRHTCIRVTGNFDHNLAWNIFIINDKQLTKDSILLPVLTPCIWPYQATKIIIRHFILVAKGKNAGQSTCISMLEEKKTRQRRNGKQKNSHLSMKFRHLFFPSGLFIHSSSSLTRLLYGGSASSGKAFMVCSKISSSILSERE